MTASIGSLLIPIAAALSLAGSPSIGSAAPRYRLVDLGANTAASAIDGHGTVAGQFVTPTGAMTAGVERAGHWRARDMSSAIAIDDAGEVLGFDALGRTVVQASATAEVVSVPPVPGNDMSYGYGIARGRVVGTAERLPDGVLACYVWSQAEGFTLFTPPGFPCQAVAINAAGQATGWHLDAGGNTVAFVWQDGTFTDLPPMPHAASAGIAEGQAINRLGHVTLFARLDDGSNVAGLSDGRSTRNLGPTTPGLVIALNDRDEVVGTDPQGEGWLWKAGTRRPLAALAGNAHGWSALQPTGIDAAGVIVGNGRSGGLPHAFMLVPLP